MFSDRVPQDRRPTRLAAALAHARSTRRLLDLTVSNPTCVGIHYPDTLLAPLSQPEGLVYRPSPFGLLDAREAVAETYAQRGLRMDARQIVLTASTSEAYSLLFKLLGDPGQSDVLTPMPSYPLFDHLTRLDGVVQRRYALESHGSWCVDLPDLDSEWTDRTRALLVVTPNNPTGSILTSNDADEIVQRCATRRVALILDEVFHDYPMRAAPLPEPEALARNQCLLFRLGGLSKMCGLPQLKLGWMTVEGPDALVCEALDRLELICDSYLSVSTPVQLAARSLLEESSVVRQQILTRVRENDGTLRRLIDSGAGAVTLLEPDGGWSAVLRVPSMASEEALVLELLQRDGVVVQPGFFFDFPHEAYFVVSLLPQPEIFAQGVQAILERIHAA
jgi:alanine-synthesizing transaminase